MRHHTSKTGDEQISCKEYVDRMKEALKVTYMFDPADGYAVQQMKEFNEKKLKSATKEGSVIEDKEEKKENWRAEGL